MTKRSVVKQYKTSASSKKKSVVMDKPGNKNKKPKLRQSGGNISSLLKNENSACKNTKIKEAELHYIQSQIFNANRKSPIGTYYQLDNPITKKKDLNYWVSVTVNKACDVLEYNKLGRQDQFRKAEAEKRKDTKLLDFISSLNKKRSSP